MFSHLFEKYLPPPPTTRGEGIGFVLLTVLKKKKKTNYIYKIQQQQLCSVSPHDMLPLVFIGTIFQRGKWLLPKLFKVGGLLQPATQMKSLFTSIILQCGQKPRRWVSQYLQRWWRKYSHSSWEALPHCENTACGASKGMWMKNVSCECNKSSQWIIITDMLISVREHLALVVIGGRVNLYWVV